jgi:hypothetical protein
MFKLIMAIRRKEGLTREEFRDYYENNHVKLAERLNIAPPGYRRNYVVDNDPLLEGVDEDRKDKSPTFDVLTETMYSSREEAEEIFTRFADPAVFNAVVEDENKFIAPGGIKFYIVETAGHPETSLT